MKSLLLAAFLLLAFTGYAQQQVSGQVKDEKGQPLPGVSVVVKGTSAGVSADFDGRYTLQSVATDATLVFSFVGYAPQEVKLNGQTTIDVTLQPDITSLDEVVVVGYGTTKVRELTGSVSSMKGSELTELNPVRIDQAMQGRIAGMQITSNSGSPGGTMNIRIRGMSTNGNNNPLIVVDGIIYSPEGLNALNPSDIESINILKDATAAIYGVLGANGVIFVTTKQGKRNSKPTFDFNGYYGIQDTPTKMNLLNATEYAVLKNETFVAGGQTAPFNNTNVGSGTNWQDKVFGTAPIQNWNLTVTGGFAKSNYSIGGSYFNQEGIVGGDKASYKRYNARLNFNTDLAEKVKLQSIFLYTHEQRKTLPENGIASVLYNTINASPLASVYTNGKYTYLEEVNDVINPIAQMANTFNLAKVNKVVGKEELSYNINDHFEVVGRAGYSYALVDGKSFSPLVYYGSGKAQNTAANADLDPKTVEIVPGTFIPAENSVSENRVSYFDYNFDAYLSYSQSLGTAHKVKGTLGTALYGSESRGLYGTAYNVPYNSNNFADISIADGNNLQNNTSSSQDRSRNYSYFLRGEYTFKDRYFLSAIVRRDASSKFGRNNIVGYFPSVSAAWIASEEGFYNSSVINFLKVRASHGAIGNDQIYNWAYRASLGGEGVYPFNDLLVTGAAIGRLGNEDLKWERTVQTDIGVDLELFNNKVNITTDFFVKVTKDLLFNPEVSGLLGSGGAGSSSPYVNAGNVRNTGIEFAINYDTEIIEGLHLRAGYNITAVKNKVIKMAKGQSFIEGGAFGVGGVYASRMEVGYPIGYFYGYKTNGIFQSDEEIASSNVTQSGAEPGDFRYVDQDGDGVINFSNDSDKTMIGSPIPDATMGLNLGLDYKGFDFSVFFYASVGNDILRNYERQQPLANQGSYWIDRWTGSGSTDGTPRLTTGLNRNAVISDFYVEDGSFLRIKNIQLGYSLPKAIVEKIRATKVRAYVSVNNLATLTGYKGFDPDFAAGAPIGAGIDYGFYPQPRIFMGGININF